MDYSRRSAQSLHKLPFTTTGPVPYATPVKNIYIRTHASPMASSVKVLLLGGGGGATPTCGSIEPVVARLSALQKGKAGPFDIVLVSG